MTVAPVQNPQGGSARGSGFLNTWKKARFSSPARRGQSLEIFRDRRALGVRALKRLDFRQSKFEPTSEGTTLLQDVIQLQFLNKQLFPQPYHPRQQYKACDDWYKRAHKNNLTIGTGC
jgi:hypothetical protein